MMVKSFFALDFSLHGEKGNNPDKPFGLSKQQLKESYHKKNSSEKHGYQRVIEYSSTKVDSMIRMMNSAIKKGFDLIIYLRTVGLRVIN